MHSLIRIFCLLSCLISIALANVPVQLYAHSLETDELSINLGVLTYNKTSGTTEILNAPEDDQLDEGEYCVGAEINGNFQCHSYAKVS